MATRFYLPGSQFASTLAPAFSSLWRPNTFGTWPRPRRALAPPVPSGLQLPLTATLSQPQASGESSAGSPADVLIAQYISDPIPAQTISGTIKGLLRTQESTFMAARSQLLVKVVSGDGTVVRGVLYAGDLTTSAPNATDEWVQASYGGRWFLRNILTSAGTAPVSLTSVNAQSGDRIVLEIGARTFLNATGNLLLDTQATGTADLISENNVTNRSWLEFSQNLVLDSGYYYTDFSENLVGAHPANWVETGGAVPTYTVNTLAGATGGVVLTKTSGSSGVYAAIRRLGLTDRTTDELRVKFRAAAATGQFGPVLSLDATAASMTGYLCAIATATQLRLFRTVASTATNVAQGVLPFTPVANTMYWIYMKRTGAVIEAKIWEASSPEPGAFQISYTDPSPLAAGGVGFASSTTGAYDLDVFQQGVASVAVTHTGWGRALV